MSFGQLIHVVQAVQLFYLSALTALCIRLSKGKALLALYALLPVIPWFHCNVVGTYFPNLSGWRYLGIALALLLVSFWARRDKLFYALLFGVVSGLVIMIDIGSGCILTAGLAFMIWLLKPEIHWLNNVLKSYVSFAAGMCISVVACATLFVATSGQLPDLSIIVRYFALLQPMAVMSSYPGVIDPVSILIFLHASYIFLSTASKSPGQMTYFAAFRACAAFLIVGWEVYYFNRRWYLNLAPVWGVYSILLLNELRVCRLLLLGRLRSKIGTSLLSAGLVIAVAPFALYNWQQCAESFMPIVRDLLALREGRIISGPSQISGTKIPETLSQFVQAKSSFLTREAQLHTLHYETVYSVLVPRQSGVIQSIPCDPYLGPELKSDWASFVTAIRSIDPSEILFDDPAVDPVYKKEGWFKNHIHILESSIADQYHLDQAACGWRIWVKNQ